MKAEELKDEKVRYKRLQETLDCVDTMSGIAKPQRLLGRHYILETRWQTGAQDGARGLGELRHKCDGWLVMGDGKKDSLLKDVGYISSLQKVAVGINNLISNGDVRATGSRAEMTWSSGMVAAVRRGIEETAADEFMAELENIIKYPCMKECFEAIAAEETSEENSDDKDEPAGCEEVSIEGDWPAPIVKALKRAHVKLGHPKVEEMVRVLRNAGAKNEAIKACRKLVCQRCATKKQPQLGGPLRVPRHPAPLTVIQADVEEVPDWRRNKKRKVLGIICEGSLYQQAATIPASTAKVYCSTYRDMWAKPLGPPDMLKVDAEKALVFGEMAAGCERDATMVVQAAGEGHCQVGLIERHNGLFAGYFGEILSDTQPVSEEEYQEALHQAVLVKNQGLHKSGATPEMCVFGRHRRLPGGLLSNPDSVTGTLPMFGSGVNFAMKCRASARKRLAEHQDRKAYRRALLKRPRPLREVSDRVAIWRKGRVSGYKAAKARWHGVGTVVGHGPGLVWVERNGDLIKACHEHLPFATKEEMMTEDQIELELLDLRARMKKKGWGATGYEDLTDAERPPTEEEPREEVTPVIVTNPDAEKHGHTEVTAEIWEPAQEVIEEPANGGSNSSIS